MTPRDERLKTAALILSGLITQQNYSSSPKNAAQRALSYADALIAAVDGKETED
jgi:hypothetical protein